MDLERFGRVSGIQNSWGGKILSGQSKWKPESLREILDERGIFEKVRNLAIIIVKSDHMLSLYLQNHRIKSYHVELGDNGQEDKKLNGDHKTPEGAFYIVEKSILNPPDQFLGARWMRLSYPNLEDAERGRKQGLIDKATYEAIVTTIDKGLISPQQTALGGGIGIHGGGAVSLGRDWTWGCVGLTDDDIEEFYDYIVVGTPVIIRR
jgi:murein L,D-transpeptidase YafK